MVLVAIIPGIAQAKPDIKGTTDRPCKPTFVIKPSITNAALAMADTMRSLTETAAVLAADPEGGRVQWAQPAYAPHEVEILKPHTLAELRALVRAHPATGRRSIWGSPPHVRRTTYEGAPMAAIARVLAAVTPGEGTGVDPEWHGAQRWGTRPVSHSVPPSLERFVYRHAHYRGDVTLVAQLILCVT